MAVTQPRRARRATGALVLLGAGALGLGGCAAAPRGPWLRRLEIEGNRAFPDRRIERGLGLRETSRVPLSRHRPFDPLALDVDRLRVEAFYRAQGYFAARVVDVDVRPAGGEAVDVVLRVEEGAPTRLAAIEVAGLPPLAGTAARRVRAAVRLRPGERFAHPRYLEAKELLSTRLRQAGFAHATVTGDVRVDRERGRAEVWLRVDPGPRVRFGAVRIDGNVRIPTPVIARRAAFDRGERFDPRRLDETRERIYALGVFSSVSVTYDERGRGDVVDVQVRVHEAPLREVRLGAGVSVERGRDELHLRAGWVHRDFLGGARRLGFELRPAYVALPDVVSPARQGPSGDVEASLAQPDVLLPHLELRGRLRYQLRVEDGYDYHGPRADLGLVRPLAGSRLIVGASYGLERLDFFDVDPLFRSEDVEIDRLVGFHDPYRLGFVEVAATLDLRDHPPDAHRGLFLDLRGELGDQALGGTFRYLKLTPDARLYVPLGPRVVAAGRLRYGELLAQGDSPVTRRYFGGGAQDQRGFGFRRLGPLVARGAAGGRPLPVGGDALVSASGELRLDVARLSGRWVGLVGFVDAGDVARTRAELEPSRPHLAAGGGLRYDTPVGPIRLDVGVRLSRLDEAPSEPRAAVHLSLGEAF